MTEARAPADEYTAALATARPPRPPLAPFLLRIAAPAPEPLSEAELSRIWAGQSFPPEALTTADGRSVRVHNPGRRNNGPGPDFFDAVLSLDGVERRGHVELHVRASAFRGHGHHLDPAYNGVALHVVYRADEGSDTALSNGSRTPVAAFAPWLERRQSDLQGWLEQPPLWQEPCRRARALKGDVAVDAALLAAGGRRFAELVDRMEREVAAGDEEDAVWRAVLTTLGAGGDRDGFRRLATALTPALARELTADLPDDEAGFRLEAALLAVAGLREAPPALVGCLPARLSPALASSGRPANRPERRLRGFVRLYLRAGRRFAAHALDCVGGTEPVKALLARWQVAEPLGGPALIGRDRAQELLLNAVLPFAATRPALRAKAEALVMGLPPVPAYGKTAFLEANLRRPDGRRAVGSALTQQGLLGFLRQWCSQDGCGRCPLS